MPLYIEITSTDLKQAAENLTYKIESNFPECKADEEAIALLLKERLETIIEKFITDASEYLESETLNKIECCFQIPYQNYYKLMAEAIPYPPR